MMMKRLTTAALAVAMLAAMPGVAFAQATATTARPLEAQDREASHTDRQAEWMKTIKARALEAIEKRLATIDELEAAIARSETVDPGHSEQLLGELRTSASGLEALAEEIRAADDLAALWVLVPKIFEDYRIYAVVAPKVHVVLVADAAGAVGDRLQSAAGTLGDVLDRLADNGIDVADAEALLSKMERLVTSGSDSAASVPDMVLALTPADYPGSTKTLRAAHSVLKSAGTDLRAAGEHAHEIVRFIKSAVGDDATDE